MISMKDKLKSFPKKIVIKEIEGYIERSLKKQVKPLLNYNQMSSKVETKKMKIQDF